MSSESDDEELAVYGTPLDPIEEDAIPRKKPLAVEDQVAVDKHGRRRFHGAFTGGFSAGFFNSVGSLEGWKPSQFISSRSDKSKTQFQRPEDFMDEEDMDEFGIAPKIIRPTGDYDQVSGSSSRKRPLQQYSDGPIPGIPVLKTLIEPTKDTIGIRLLVGMGWKPGQGVGPRLSKAEKSAGKKIPKPVKVYGCALPSVDDQRVEDQDESEDDEEDLENITFAPDDFEPYIVKPKQDCFGLGYTGLDRSSVLSSHIDLFGPSLVMQEKKKKVSIRGQAFGVGAFEKEDEDIYAGDDMSQYDFALDTPQMLAEKRRKERNAKSAPPSSSTDVLEGFVLSSSVVVRKRFPPPPLPPGYTPRPPSWRTRFSVAQTPPASAGHMTRLSANERAVIVNSEPTQVVPPQTKISEEPRPVEVERTVGTFRPFVTDPEKQLRYEKYLTLSNLGQTDQLPSLQPFTMTEWERERERAEFEQASRLYRPLSAAFSDRFVSAGQAEDAIDPLAPVTRYQDADQDVRDAAKAKMFGRLTRRKEEWLPHSTLCKRFNIPQPGVSSSSMKAKSSRPKFSVFNFLDAEPFNVPASTSSSTDPTSTEVVEMRKDLTITPSASTSVMPQDVSEVKTKEDDLEQLVDSTNKLDLYKAIFLSSSDESENDEKDEAPVPPSVTKQPSATEMNVLRNTSPPRGIFANLDLDSLSQKKTPVQENTPMDINVSGNKSPPRGIFGNLNQDAFKKTGPNKTGVLWENNHKNSEIDEPSIPRDESFIYGPSLPKNIPQPQKTVIPVIDRDSSESEEDWVELNDSSDSDKDHRQSKKKHSKKSKKSKKHKEKKHKHKKKRK